MRKNAQIGIPCQFQINLSLQLEADKKMSSIAKDKESFLSQGGKALFLSWDEKIPASKNPSTHVFDFFSIPPIFFLIY